MDAQVAGKVVHKAKVVLVTLVLCEKYIYI